MCGKKARNRCQPDASIRALWASKHRGKGARTDDRARFRMAPCYPVNGRGFSCRTNGKSVAISRRATSRGGRQSRRPRVRPWYWATRDHCPRRRAEVEALRFRSTYAFLVRRRPLWRASACGRQRPRSRRTTSADSLMTRFYWPLGVFFSSLNQ